MTKLELNLYKDIYSIYLSVIVLEVLTYRLQGALSEISWLIDKGGREEEMGRGSKAFVTNCYKC